MIAEQNALSCDDDDELGLDPTDRARSLSQLQSDDDGNIANGNSMENEFIAKDSVESDRIDTDEKDHTTERLEDEPAQVECDSSPSNPVVQGVPQIAGTASDQTLSPFRDNRLSNSPEMDSNS